MSVKLNEYHVSRRTGFLLEDPLEKLPDYFEDWNWLSANAPDLISSHTLRREVEKIPILDYTRLIGYRELRLAHIQLSIIGSCYVWQEGDAGVPKSIPACIAVPWWNISQQIGLKPIIGHASFCLANWKYRDPSQPVSHDNLVSLYVLPGEEACDWFCVATCMVEFTFVEALEAIQDVLDGSYEEDDVKVANALIQITNTVDDMRKALKRMNEKLPADTFYNVLRPFLSGWGGESNPLPNGLIYEGISEEPVQLNGGSAAQSSTLQLLDSLLGIQHKPDKQKFLNKMRDYMPPAHSKLIEDVGNSSNFLKNLVNKTNNNRLQEAFNACVAAVTHLRSYHIQLVTKYIVIMANRNRSGKFEAVSKKGTGGTDLLPFLKELRDDTKETMVQ
ncbi:myoglobin-like [Gigantopelta aegis]|uniref:myoglobin-like n=1 Tax=Gigantopelta aegis TaxID=1735272 RepID=UPI001B88C734|nr:myoglobin-like [Gigantopelta aegis]